MRFSQEMIKTVFNLVAAVLNLGQLGFDATVKTDKNPCKVKA